MWKLWESHKATGSALTPVGLLLPARRLQGGWARVWGPPGAVTEGSQAPTKPLPWERLAHGASCRADVPGRMQLRRAIAGGQASVFPWLPTSPLSPCCIPRWINVQENPAPGLLPQAGCQGKSPGGCSPAAPCSLRDGFGHRDLGATSVLAARAMAPSQRPFPVPAGMLQAQMGLEPPQPCRALHPCSLGARWHRALLAGQCHIQGGLKRCPGMLCSPRGKARSLRNPDGQTDPLGVAQETCGTPGPSAGTARCLWLQTGSRESGQRQNWARGGGAQPGPAARPGASWEKPAPRAF